MTANSGLLLIVGYSPGVDATTYHTNKVFTVPLQMLISSKVSVIVMRSILLAQSIEIAKCDQLSRIRFQQACVDSQPRPSGQVPPICDSHRPAICTTGTKPS